MLTLEANYQKKIGLPQYSSHQFSLTIKTELADITQVEKESARLYSLLQTNVDKEMQKVGFLPEKENGNGNGHSNGNGHQNGNGSRFKVQDEMWNCTIAQKNLVLKIVEENKLDLSNIARLAQERFDMPLNQINTMQASGLIKELVEKYPRQQNGNGNHRRSFGRATR